jgi:exopolysaccharide biosynthesis polyprenyl glycosylphosphotransferase
LWPIFDLLALALAWQAARAACVFLVPDGTLSPSTAGFLGAPLAASILVVWLAIGLWLKYYTARLGMSFSRACEMIIVVVGLLVLTIPSLYRGFPLELLRSFAVLFAPLSLVSLAGARYAASIITARTNFGWAEEDRIAVIGRAADAEQMVHLIRAGGRPNQVAGVILPQGLPESEVPRRAHPLATTRTLAETINRERLGRIIIIHGAMPDAEEEQCCKIARSMGVTISRTVPPSIPDVNLGFSIVSGVYLLDFRPTYFTRKQELIKRVFDVASSLALIALTSPILILSAVLVKLTSKGPLFYTSYRVGRGGRYFLFYKFRSMKHNAGEITRGLVAQQNEKGGHLFKIRNDPRITPMGRIIRRYSIDELPQLFNVLIGDMSLVGPRPLPSEDMEGDGMSRQYAEWSEMRARALPGITGLWQIKGRSNTGFERMMALDIEYIQNWSLQLDLIILLKTPAAVLSAAGAY